MAVIILNSDQLTEVDYIPESLTYEDSVNARGIVSFSVLGSTPPLAIGEDLFVKEASDEPLELIGGGNLELIGGGTLSIIATKYFWGGTVEGYDETDYTMAGSTTLLFTYRCVDFSQIASKRLVSRSFTERTAGYIVRSFIIEQDGNPAYPLDDEGITAGTIQDGQTIESIAFNWVSAESCLDELAELTGYHWWIDYDKNLHFCARDATTSAFNITDASRPYLNIRFSRSRTQLRTTQYVRAGFDLGDSRAEVQFGDGTKRAFVAELAVGQVPTIEVDTGGGYSTKTVGLAGAITGKQWYYNIDARVFSQDTSETVLSATDKVKITYQPRLPLIVSSINSALETDRATIESGSGRYEHMFDAPEFETRAEAVNKAVALLARYGNLQETVTYTTDTTGLVAGTLQQITLSEHGVDAQYLIERVTATLKENGEFRYTVQASATQAYGGWTQYFKARTRQDRKFVLRENETILNLREVADSMTMQDAPSRSTSTGTHVYDTAKYNLADYA
jgi:hypothetical protein